MSKKSDQVSRFLEKIELPHAVPSTEVQGTLLELGLYAVLLRELPESRAASAMQALRKAYEAMPSISVDYGVMEQAASVEVLVSDIDWDDLGSWDAVARHRTPDEDGNRLRGDVTAVDSRDNVVDAEVGMSWGSQLDYELVRKAKRFSDMLDRVELCHVLGFKNGDGTPDTSTLQTYLDMAARLGV